MLSLQVDGSNDPARVITVLGPRVPTSGNAAMGVGHCFREAVGGGDGSGGFDVVPVYPVGVGVKAKIEEGKNKFPASTDEPGLTILKDNPDMVEGTRVILTRHRVVEEEPLKGICRRYDDRRQ